MARSRPRYRCPICRVLYWNGRARCPGGWPIQDPDKPGAFVPEHREVPVVRDEQTRGPVIVGGPCVPCQWDTRCPWCDRPPATEITPTGEQV